MSAERVCSVCSVRLDSKPGVVSFADKRKWLLAPVPCPECEARSLKEFAGLGRELAIAREKAILTQLLCEGSNGSE